MNNNILISVITITYNSSAFIRDTIAGVLAQTYSNIEYIIGDDCSTDDTWNIINEYNDSRIIKYRNDSNLSEYSNRNKAINLAKGEYFIFIDGDDVILPHAIEYYVYMVNLFPQAAILIQKNYFENIIFPMLLNSKQSFFNMWMSKINLITSSLSVNLFKTKVAKELGCFSTEFKTSDDDLRIKICAKYPVLLIQGWVSWPRVTPNQASSKIKLSEYIEESIKMLKKTTINNNISKEMIEDATKAMNKMYSIIALKSLFKFKLNDFLTIIKSLNISYIEMLNSLKFKPKFSCELLNYTPTTPYKKEFLQITKSKNQ